MKFFKSIILAFILMSFFGAKAQNTIVNSEIGVFLGPTFMQTDYGEAESFSSSSSNVGMDFGIAYIADFSDSRYDSGVFSWLADHMKTRIELSFSKVNLEHDGLPVEEGPQSTIDKFKGMTGDVKLFNIGGFGEWYFTSLTKNGGKIEPYLLTGISYTSAKASMSISDAGFPYNLEDLADDDKNAALSFSYGLGARYKLDDIDLIIEGRFQSFMSDEIEALEPKHSGNKNNDSQVMFKVGAVFHLN